MTFDLLGDQLKYNSILDHAKNKLSKDRLIMGGIWNHVYAKLAFTSLDSRDKFFP